MRTLKAIMVILTIFNLNAFASCMVKVEKDSAFTVRVWKHTEDQIGSDTVDTMRLSNAELGEIFYVLQAHHVVTLIFNKGVFTSMKTDDGKTVKWANASLGEKDMILFIQTRFDINEK